MKSMYISPQDAHLSSQAHQQAYGHTHEQTRARLSDQHANSLPLSSLVVRLDEVLSDLKRRRALSINTRLSIEDGEIEAINALGAELDTLRGAIGSALLTHLTQAERSSRGSLYEMRDFESDVEITLTPARATERTFEARADDLVFERVVESHDLNSGANSIADSVADSVAGSVADSVADPVTLPIPLIAERIIDAQPISALPEAFKIGTAHWGWDATLTEPELSPLLDHAVIEEPMREDLFEFETSEHALNFLEDELESDPNTGQLERILKRAMSSPLKPDDSRFCTLMLGRTIPEGRPFRKLRKEVRILQQELAKELEEASSPESDEGWEHAHLFSGQRIELVGGDVVHHVLNRVRRDLPEAIVNWTPTSTRSGERTLISLEQSARSGSVDMIILIKSFIGHRVSTRFAPLHGKCFSGGAPLQVRYVSRGYGISQIKQLLLECARERGLT